MEGHSNHHVKKRISWKKVGIAAGILAIIIIGIILITKSSALAANSIKIDYTVKAEDGIILDKNVSVFKIGSVAQSIGFVSSKLDSEIEKIGKGQSRTIILEAADGFGEYDEASVYVQPTKIERNVKIDRIVTYPLAAVEQYFGEDPIVGKTYDIKGANWNYTVVSKTRDNVTLRIDTYVGKEIVSNFITSKVAQISDTKISMFLSATEDSSEDTIGAFKITSDASYIYLKYENLPETKDFGYFIGRLSDNGTAIIIDANSPYAGKKAIVEIKILDINKKAQSSTVSIKSNAAKIAGAPTLEAYVVSRCPYGLQMMRILAEVQQAIGSKANIILRYMGEVENGKVTSMHGTQEADENLREICIREEQPTKFWNYIACYIKSDGKSSSCLKDSGIDENKLKTCMSGSGIGYAQADFEAANEALYACQSETGQGCGSPTLTLNGKYANEFKYGGRTAEAVKELVCSAFSTQPSECSKTLQTSQAATWFSESYFSGSSGSSGSC